MRDVTVKVESPRTPRRAAIRPASVAAWAALVLLLAVAGVFLLLETRGTTLWFDEWSWALDRRGGDLETYLRPHNGHLSLVPVAIYKLLFATAGIDDYRPYRVLVIGAHLAVVALVFAYARRRAGDLLGLCAAALLLFLGPAWQNIIWPFNLSWLISLGAGVAALLALDRRDRAGDVAACGLLALSLASSALGVPVALAVAIDVVATRSRRQLWIAAVPLALYALWWIGYQDADQVGLKHALVTAPGYVAQAAAGTLSALAGLSGETVPGGEGTILAWGPPLAVAAVAAVIWRLERLRAVPVRVAALLAALFAFWVLTALGRAFISPPYASRYLYVGALFAVLLAAELMRGSAISRRALVLMAVAVAAAVVSNVGTFRDAGRYLRAQGEWTRADLGAVELAREAVSPGHELQHLPGHPLVKVTAGRYFDAARELGSPAASPAELAAKPEAARLAADAELIAIHGVRLAPAPPRAALAPGPRPTVEIETGGSAASRRSCVVFRPDVGAPAGAVAELQLTVPPGGVSVAARDGAAAVAVRRFAGGFRPIGRLPAATPAVLRIGRDRSTQPWRLRLQPAAAASVCGLR